jgi:hypothetical protein
MLDVYGELFMMMAGVNMQRVPYHGAPPAVTDLVGGRVDVVFDTFAASIALVKAGQLRALAVTTATRSAALPDIPSLGDFLPGYDASNWKGIGAPKNTPPDIVERPTLGELQREHPWTWLWCERYQHRASFAFAVDNLSDRFGTKPSGRDCFIRTGGAVAPSPSPPNERRPRPNGVHYVERPH